jgi:hypothetical protein
MQRLPPIMPPDPPVMAQLPRAKFRVSALLWIGLGLIVFGSTPLVLVLCTTTDPQPNPVGPGLLCFLTFWPGLILAIVGIARSLWRFRRARSEC